MRENTDQKKLRIWTLFTQCDKCHLLVTGNYEASANINEFEIETSKREKIIITSLCKKSSQKLHALARIAQYMDFEKRRSLMKVFVISQFNYCPLI